MNERYLFRVWDIDGKEYLKEKQYQYKIVDITVRNNPEQKQDITLYCGSMGGSTLEHCINCKEGFIVEQSTGLKDKNGKLVFENDVVNIDSSTVNICDTRAIVIFEDGSFILQWIPKGSGADKLRRVKKLFNHDVGNIRWWEIEVIGNIRQNSELLEKGGK